MRLRERLLRRIAWIACRHAYLVVGVFLLGTAFAITVILTLGKVSTDYADILPRKSEACERYIEVAEALAADLLIVTLEADDPADIEAVKPFAGKLAARLATKEYAHLVNNVEYKVGEQVRRFAEDLARERGYIYLDGEDLKLLDEKLETESIRRQMAKNRAKLDAAGSEYFEKRIVPDPLNLFEIYQRRGSRATAGGGFNPREGESHLVSPDGTMLLVLVQGTESVKNVSFDQKLMAGVVEAEEKTWDELIAGAEGEGTEGGEGGAGAGTWRALRERVEIGHAGAYALAVDQNEKLVTDLGKSFVMSLVLVMVVFALGFRRLGALFYIGFPLVASVTWTLAAAFLAFGHISTMSGGFAAILVGLSVDFAIHIYNHYVGERAAGVEVTKAVEGALIGTGSSIFFGALTSSVAFFGVMLTRFVGLSEFGFLAGIGVLFGMMTMLFVLPALLYIRSRIGEEPAKVTRIYGFKLDKVARAVGRRPGLVFGVSASLALAAAVFVYIAMDVYFFDSDLRNLRADSEVIDLAQRIQVKFGTNLNKVVAVSRGATEEEALENAGKVLARAEAMARGRTISKAAWPAGAETRGRPFIRVDGCKVRVRRVEITLPAGVELPSPRAANTQVETLPDGSRVLIYPFTEEEGLTDWEFEGPIAYMGGAELKLKDGTAAVMRWRHELKAPAEIVFAVRPISDPDKVVVGLNDDVKIEAEVPDTGTAPDGPTGEPWPLMKDDQVRFSLRLDPGSGGNGQVELAAGRGTLIGIKSVAKLVPPLSRQRASAAFLAGVDMDRVEDDMEDAARSNRLNPDAFADFVDGFRDMVEKAQAPKFLTFAEIAANEEFRAALSRYHATPSAKPLEPGAPGATGTGGGGGHLIATYLYPERGELPREWYERVEAGLEGAGELSATRLVSLAVRDVVYEDFSWLTKLVFFGVAVVLLWSFKSFRWSAAALGPVLASFALMLGTMLILGHRLNFLNVLVFPILVGIGIDYGIHVVHRFRQSVPVAEIMTETGRAFVLTTLTTMAGFGSLIISRCRGLSSFGFVTIVGMSFVLFTSLVALPSLLAIIEQRRAAGEPNKDARDMQDEDGEKKEGGGT